MESQNSGVVYCMTCKNTGKKYIGQTKERKVRNSVSTQAYGVKQRFNYHIASATRSASEKRPLYQDIRKYGREAFKIEVLKTCPLDERDYWETKYIKKYKTLHPDGYNLYSRNHSSEGRVLHEKDEVLSVEIYPVKAKGVNALARIYINNTDGKRERMDFGQSHKCFSKACEEAREYSHHICEKSKIFDLTEADDDLLKYELRIQKMSGENITRIRVGDSSRTTTKVYIRTQKTKGHKDEVMFEVGGKKRDDADVKRIVNKLVERMRQKNTEVIVPEKYKEHIS